MAATKPESEQAKGARLRHCLGLQQARLVFYDQARERSRRDSSSLASLVAPESQDFRYTRPSSDM